MIFDLSKDDIIQLLGTSVAFLLSILFPLINYFAFKSFLSSGINVGSLESTYDTTIIITLILGFSSTIVTYLVYRLPKHSVQRSLLALFQNALNIVLIIVFSNLGRFWLIYENVSLYLDIRGIYLILIVGVVPFVAKSIYDTVDFRQNSDYYSRLQRRKQLQAVKKINKLIKCGNCDYMCRAGWKKCPICKTKLK